MDKFLQSSRNILRKQFRIAGAVLNKMFPFINISKFDKHKSVLVFTGQNFKNQKDPDFWRHRAFFWSIWFSAVWITTM